jgi:lipopolysaccharide biosynthesis protein
MQVEHPMTAFIAKLSRKWSRPNSRESRMRAIRTSGLMVLTAAYHWLKIPDQLGGEDVCFFVTYAPSGRLTEHAKFHARSWTDHGFKLVLIVALDDLQHFQPGQDLGFCTGILLRHNIGYDFGAWAAALRLVPTSAQAKMLVTANDSVYGPFDNFGSMLARVRACSADVVGLTESFQVRRHFQSYMLFFKASALASTAFRSFWMGVRGGSRPYVVTNYELTLIERMEAGGLSTTALFPADRSRPATDPTLRDWQILIDSGFPFIKAKLLRDNLFGANLDGWPAVVAARGYNPDLILKHLEDRRAAARPEQADVT